jgi:hypothetical protein
MKLNTIFAVLLVCFGIAAFGHEDLAYRGQTAVGAPQVTAETDRTMPVSPLLGTIALIGGLILVIRSTAKA